MIFIKLFIDFTRKTIFLFQMIRETHKLITHTHFFSSFKRFFWYNNNKTNNNSSSKKGPNSVDIIIIKNIKFYNPYI